MTLLLVGAGGFLGAIARYLVDVGGSLLLGMVAIVAGLAIGRLV